ncbi:MAG: hypothetical protein JOY92_11350 [Verrucomicrobia bacterium]|nr:hypothetical protein [Verrucomicrobiota bacterium]
MLIQLIEPRRLPLQIADRIRSLIAGGEFPPGIRVERGGEPNTSIIE